MSAQASRHITSSYPVEHQTRTSASAVPPYVYSDCPSSHESLLYTLGKQAQGRDTTPGDRFARAVPCPSALLFSHGSLPALAGT